MTCSSVKSRRRGGEVGGAAVFTTPARAFADKLAKRPCHQASAAVDNRSSLGLKDGDKVDGVDVGFVFAAFVIGEFALVALAGELAM